MKERVVGVAAAAVMVNALLTGCGEDYPDVAVPSIAAELPPQVAAIASDVVKMSVTVVNENGSLTASYGTGVRINPAQIVSAGHVLNQPLSCDETFVDAPTTEPRDAGYGADLGTRVIANDVRLGEAAEGDTALVTLTAEEAAKLDPFQAITVRDTVANPLQPGEVVYGYGYGAASLTEPNDLDARTPRQSALSSEQLAGGYDKPWIIGGVVLGAMPDGKVAILTGLQDFSEGRHRSEATFSHGDSGAPLFDSQGRYVGVLTSGDSELDIDDIEELSGAEPVGLPDDYDPSMFAMQPISPGLIGQLGSKMPQPCTPAAFAR